MKLDEQIIYWNLWSSHLFVFNWFKLGQLDFSVCMDTNPPPTQALYDISSLNHMLSVTNKASMTHLYVWCLQTFKSAGTINMELVTTW